MRQLPPVKIASWLDELGLTDSLTHFWPNLTPPPPGFGDDLTLRCGPDLEELEELLPGGRRVTTGGQPPAPSLA